MVRRVWIGVPAGTIGKYGNYVRAVQAAGGIACYDAGAAVKNGGGTDGSAGEKNVRPEDCGALLLPGGGDLDPRLYGQENRFCRNLEPDRDALERDLLERFTAAGKPVLGICRGMQSVNVFFGGTLAQDIPGHTQVDGRDRLHPVRTASGPFADLCPPEERTVTANGERTFTVNSSHHQAVDRPGTGLVVEQWAPDGVAEAVRHQTMPVCGVQWHPERLAGEVGGRLFRAFLALA